MRILVCLPKDEVTSTFLTTKNQEKLNQIGDIKYNEMNRNYTQEEFATQIIDMDVVIIGWKSPVIDETILDKANKLKLIVHFAGSVAPFLCDEVFKKNIKVICGNEDIAKSVAEGIIGYILAFNRDVCKYQVELKKEGMWKPNTYNTLSLIGKTVGIVSYGSISRYLAHMLQGFDVKILVYSRSLAQEELDKYNMQLVSLEELFSKSDIITIQTALNPHTINMIDKNLLSLIKKDGLFINTARAKVVNENDLISELSTGRFNAILDVYYQEPLPIDNPYRLMSNVFMMPHMAGPTNECRSILAANLIDDITNILTDGTSINLVSESKYKSMTRPM